MGIQHRNNRRRKRKLLNLLGSLATESPQYFGNAYQRINQESNNAESPAARIEREAAEELECRAELAEQFRRERIRRSLFSGGTDVTERPEPAQAQAENEGTATGGSLP